MVDIKTTAPSLYLRDEELRRGIELLYFAYRDFTRDPDELLAEHGFGRAHHRVIHFVRRHPGMPVSELLRYLNITKQSLSRVLGHLIDDGYVTQKKGPDDKRQRLLDLTEKGLALEEALSAPQRARMARAYRNAGAEAVAGFWSVLFQMVDDQSRSDVEKHIRF